MEDFGVAQPRMQRRTPQSRPKHGLWSAIGDSMQPKLLAWWDAIYHTTFPDIVQIERVPTGTDLQKAGVDVILHRGNGQLIRIDEKYRRVSYGDLALEFESTETLPGWIEKDAPIDYLFYGVWPKGDYWILPWPILKQVWLENKTAWLRRYPIIQAVNTSWVSRSVTVPWSVILAAVANKLVGSYHQGN